MNYRKWLWLALVLLVIHNIEEYLTMSDFYNRNMDAIPAFATRFAHAIPDEVFLTMLVVVTLLALLLVYVVTNKHTGGRGFFWALVFISAGLMGNGFNHLGMAVILKAYVPGLLSAVTLLLPLATYFCITAIKEKRTDIPTLIISFLTGYALLVPIIFAARALATQIFS